MTNNYSSKDKHTTILFILIINFKRGVYIMYPQVEVSLPKLRENVRTLKNICVANDVSMWAVTKCFCGNPEISGAIAESGADMLADARISNLKKLKDISIKKVLLRIPMHSEVEEVVEFANYSLNSELSTLKLLSEAAIKKSKIHNVVIMIDLGDLREGVWPDKLEEFLSEAVKLNGIKIKGFGVNLTCYGGVVPDEKNLGKLIEISKEMAEKFNLDIEIISGGNSSSFYLLTSGGLPKGINNLRLGEIVLLGRETAYGNAVDGLNQDVFKLRAQIIELKEKPSLPIGTIGMDAFGNKPEFEDRGIIKRAIIGVGRQDIDPGNMHPVDAKINILGSSSDHTILDVTNSDTSYKVGDIVEFSMDYGCLLKAMTSEYVEKAIIK